MEPQARDNETKKDKFSIGLPPFWAAKLRETAIEHHTTQNDIVLAALRTYTFLSQERKRGCRIFASHPNEEVQRELMFLDLPDPMPVAQPNPLPPVNDEVMAYLDQRLDEIVAAINTPEGRAASQRAHDANSKALADRLETDAVREPEPTHASRA